MNDKLLEPSLQSGPYIPIFSSGALVAAAFFGGGFAVTVLAAENSRRLKKLSVDAVWLIGGFLLTVLAVFLSIYYADLIGSRSIGFVNRALGLLLAGGFYLLNRKHYRAISNLGVKPASPWIPVILSILAGIVVSVAVIAVARSLIL